MKTLFDTETHGEIIERLGKLNQNTGRQWGKMSPSQMMEHTARAMEMATCDTPMKQAFIGKAIGWIFKPGFLADRPMPKSAPTGPDFIVKDEPDFEATRTRLKEVMGKLHTMGEAGTDGKVHRFFGPLSGRQWGETQYKHLDHHLRQFGV